MDDDLYARLMDRMRSGCVPVRHLLGRFHGQNELNNQPVFWDAVWSFWYCLGAVERPDFVADFGSRCALETSCLILGGHSPKAAVFGPKDERFARANVKIAGAELSAGRWKLAVVFADFSPELDSIWESMDMGGLLCRPELDPKSEQEFIDFGKTKNREPVFCRFRHQYIGLMRK